MVCLKKEIKKETPGTFIFSYLLRNSHWNKQALNTDMEQRDWLRQARLVETGELLVGGWLVVAWLKQAKPGQKVDGMKKEMTMTLNFACSRLYAYIY